MLQHNLKFKNNNNIATHNKNGNFWRQDWDAFHVLWIDGCSKLMDPF